MQNYKIDSCRTWSLMISTTFFALNVSYRIISCMIFFCRIQFVFAKLQKQPFIVWQIALNLHDSFVADYAFYYMCFQFHCVHSHFIAFYFTLIRFVMSKRLQLLGLFLFSLNGKYNWMPSLALITELNEKHTEFS